MNSLPEVITTGAMPVAMLAAVVAGLASFVSPCVLPLVPGYLGYLTGATGLPLEQHRRSRMALGAALFVAGFTTVFVVMFASFSALTQAVIGNLELLSRVLGVVVILLGLVFVGALPGGFLGGRVQLKPFSSRRPAAGLAGAPLLGAIFGLGWSPCISPTLAAVLSLASGQGGGATRGVVLAVGYGLGLGLPFIVVAAGYARGAAALAVLRRHQRAMQVGGGLLLVTLGGLMVAGVWVEWMSRLGTVITGWTVL